MALVRGYYGLWSPDAGSPGRLVSGSAAHGSPTLGLLTAHAQHSSNRPIVSPSPSRAHHLVRTLTLVLSSDGA